jgi:hypothetical protein
VRLAAQQPPTQANMGKLLGAPIGEHLVLAVVCEHWLESLSG